ncbi:unnamed protein product [Leptosia nina]|uniref:Pentapeptide repeat-containing protein n=1 Tax=Leptosia nina TaxID=320188 RepID=A0AAV1JHH6_9NEOP
MILTFAFCITLIQLSTAQVFSFNPRNSHPNVIQGQHAHNIPQNNLNTVLANNRASIARPLPYGNINNLFNSNTNLNLANAQLVNTELANAELENAKFANTQLANAEIANARLANAQITNAELANAKFANSQIAKAQLANAELANAKFANAQFANAELTNAKYANAQINNAEIANTRALQSNWLNRNVYAEKTNLENPNLGLNKRVE